MKHPKVIAANTIFKTFSTHKNRETITKAVNKLADLYNSHKAEVQYKIEAGDLEDVNGMDFNEWGHDALDEIEDNYFALKFVLGNLNFQEDGYNIIEVQ